MTTPQPLQAIVAPPAARQPQAPNANPLDVAAIRELASITDGVSLEIPAAGTLDGDLRIEYQAHGLDFVESLPGIAKAVLIFWPASQ